MSTPSSSRATLKDVARESGVSSATVSFVLNRTSGQTISAATRERVLAAADRLGYTPHRIARALREGSSRTVLVSTVAGAAGDSLESFIGGLEAELRQHGYTLLVVRRDLTGALPADLLETIAPRAVLDPVATYATDVPAADLPAAENWEGGWAYGLAAHTMTQLRYLADQGHREIVFALPEDGPWDRLAELRLAYARTASAKLGLPEPPVVRLGSERDAASAELKRFRERHPGVSAVAAFNDDVALLVLGAMTDLGLAAPTDLAVIGFDESPYGALWRPALTTVRIDAASYGRRAARGAIGLELGEWPSSPSSVVRRESA